MKQNEIDVTMLVFMDEAVRRHKGVTEQLMKEGMPLEVAESALERNLSEIRKLKCDLYASVIMNTQGAGKEKKECVKTGTVDDLLKDIQQK